MLRNIDGIQVHIMVSPWGRIWTKSNYPTPFNPTTISYSLPTPGLVLIKVYDVLGNEITTLINEEKTAGNNEISFDGSTLSSGVYLYKLQAGKFSDIKKFI